VTAPYRVLVTGSRDWDDAAAVRAALNSVLAEIPAPRPIIVVHGDCPTGADIMAKVWATTWCQDERVTEEPHPAAWHLGRKAGPERNLAMVRAGADVCLAFIGPCTSPRCDRIDAHGSHGATGCATLAEATGVPVRRWTE
jgi:hypothetical protein